MALQQKQMNFPPDMIGEIASYMGQEAREASKSHSKVSPYGWNVLGLVSKTWRNAVFYSATLWKEVVITSVEALRNVMIRSGRCTVTVRGIVSGDGGTSVRTELRTHYRRMKVCKKQMRQRNISAHDRFCFVRELAMEKEMKERILERAKEEDLQKLVYIRRALSRITAFQLTMSSLMLQRLGGPDRTRAQALEDLDLRRTDKHGQVDLSLFASPVLQRLKLSGAGFDFHEFHMLMCPALTDLTLSKTQTPVTTGEIIGLLSSTPRLHSLKLETDIFPCFALDGIVKVVTLQELRHLEISIWGTGEAVLLALVNTSRLAYACLDIVCTEELTDVMDLLGRRTEGFSRVHLAGCTIYAPNPQSIHLMLTPEAAAVSYSAQTSGICLSFIEFDDRHEDVILGLIGQHLGSYLGATEYLSVQDGRAYTGQAVETWREVYLLMDNIKGLHISGRSTSTLPTGLVFPERVGRLWEYPALFPLLESIELKSIWFRQSSRPADRDEGDFWNRLISSCQRRGDNQIQELTIIKGINITGKDIRALRRLFNNVNWDGLRIIKYKNDVHEDGVDWEDDDENEDE